VSGGNWYYTDEAPRTLDFSRCEDCALYTILDLVIRQVANGGVPLASIYGRYTCQRLRAHPH
jgi:hypothetical protein